MREKKAGTCTFCGAAAYSPRAYKCNDHFIGCRPVSVESAVARALRDGRLRPVGECACVDCGAQAKHYDHRDYNLPDTVEPVCVKCNSARGPAIPYGWNADGTRIQESV